MAAQWAKMLNGEWAIRSEVEVPIGELVTVTKRDGSSQPVRCAEFIQTGTAKDGTELWFYKPSAESKGGFKGYRRRRRTVPPTPPPSAPPPPLPSQGERYDGAEPDPEREPAGGPVAFDCDGCGRTVSEDKGALIYFAAYSPDGTLEGRFCDRCVNFAKRR